jgi:hypothetical protein
MVPEKVGFAEWFDFLKGELVARRVVRDRVEIEAMLSPIDVFGYYRSGLTIEAAADRLMKSPRFQPCDEREPESKRYLKDPGGYQPGDASSWKRPTTSRRRKTPTPPDES